MSYSQPSSPLYQRCPHTNMLFAYWPLGPDAAMYSALLGNVHPQRKASYTDGEPLSRSKPRKDRESTRRRLASIFTRRSSDDSPPSSPSSSASLSDAETLSDTKSVRRGIFRRRTTSSKTAKSTSTSGSKGSSKKAKKSVTFSEASSGGRGQQYLSDDYPLAWSYVVW
jgi:hypothetical protein